MKLFIRLLLCFLLFGTSCSNETKIIIDLENEELPLYANNMDQKLLTIQEITQTGFKIDSLKKYQLVQTGNNYKIIGDKKNKVEKETTIIILSTLKIGTGSLRIDILDNDDKIVLSKTYDIKTIEDDRDLDEDGFPDAMELRNENDREAFLNWFTQIVEIQFYNQAERWSKGNRDCSGLARFAFIEALKEHDSQWKRRWKFLFDWSMIDVERFHYPDIPFVKKKVFRIQGGSFVKEDLTNNKFSNFAQSEYLMKFNTKFISKKISQAQRGDLLFFKNNKAYHLMIYLGHQSWMKKSYEQQHSFFKKTLKYTPDKLPDVVYHTGPINNTEGEVRRVSLASLNKHPNPIWRPVEENPHFLGVYRWHILN